MSGNVNYSSLLCEKVREGDRSFPSCSVLSALKEKRRKLPRVKGRGKNFGYED